jgi:hypothetical protein
LIEQGSKAFSAIHKRLHYSQGQEFKLLAKLYAENLTESFQFALAGASSEIFAADFDGRVDIIPVSDPNIFSSTQRIAQAQAILQMAQSAPQLHDLHAAYKRMYEAIRIPNIEEILKEPKEAKRMDPIDENMSVLYGKPIKAFVEQAPQMQQIEAFRNAQQKQQQQNPLQYAQQLAQLEAQALKARTQSEIQADQAKAASDIKIKQLEAKQDMQIDAAKAQADLQAKIAKLEADLKLEREKTAAKIQMEAMKNEADK